MAETRVVIRAEAEQAIAEFNRLRIAATTSMTQMGSTADQQLQRTTVSAAQTAAALRQVPAQFTDIVVSLQAGQNPLTVLLQQGGQLRDSFGSAGAAMRAVGGYAVSLINPVTVLAAAGAALAVAYNQGAKEADAYARAIILTGNSAGTTTGQLDQMARSVSKTVGTQGDAAAALAALVNTGRVGVDNLQQFATTAVSAERAIGIAAADTAKDLSDLAKSPLEASLKLNETYNYLTGAVYAQIKALQDQGKTEEAGEVAQKAFAQALDERSAKMTQRLGLIEKAWRGIKGAAAGAWDAMLDIGREETPESEIDRLRKKIAKAEAKAPVVNRKDVGETLFAMQQERFSGQAEAKGNLAADKARLELLEGQLDKKNRMAAIDAARQKFDAADIEWQKTSVELEERKTQLGKELAAVREKGLAAGASDESISKAQLAVRKKYADVYNQAADQQIELIKRRGILEDEVAERSRTALESSKAAGLVSEENYLVAVEQLDQAAFTRQKARLQEELRLTTGKQNSEKEAVELRGQIASLDEQSMSRRIKLGQDLDALDINNTRKAAQNYADLVDKEDATIAGIRKQIQAQRDANAQLGLSAFAIAELTASRLEDAAAQKEQIAASLSDPVGALTQRYLDEAKALRELAQEKRDGAMKEAAVKAADEAANASKRMAEKIESSLTDALMRGFESGKSFAENLRDTTVAMFKTMILQPTIQGVVSGSFGAGTSSTTGSTLQTVSGLGSMYNAFAGLGGTVTSLGNLFGSSAVSAFGTGLANGAGVSEAIAAYNAAGMTSVASSMSAGAGLSTGISSAIAAIPGWGWAALGAAAVGAYLLNDGPEQNTRLQFTSNNTAGNISINERGNEGKSDAYIAGYGKSAFGTFGVNSTFWAPAESETVQNFIKTVTQTDDALSAFLTTTEKANVTSYLTGKTSTANTGAEGNIGNAGEELSKVFAQRMTMILDGIEPGLSALETSFSGTSQELASEVSALLQYRAALKDSGEAVFGAKVTLQEIAALKLPTEATSVALNRIANEFNATNQVAQLLGKESSTAFGSVGLASEAARAQLILLSGGLTAFSSQATAFAQNYLTEAERLAPVAKQLDIQLAALGLTSIPQTKAEFKSLVMGLDLSTEQGQKLYAGLMALQDAFSQVHAQTSDMKELLNVQAQLYEVTGNKAGAAAVLEQQHLSALDGMSAETAMWTKKLWDAQAAQKAASDSLSAVSAAYSAVETAAQRQRAELDAAYTKQSTALQDQIDALTQTDSVVATRSKALADLLHSTIESMSTLTEQQLSRQEASAQIEAALAIAKAGGVLPSADSLKGALSVLSKDSASQYATSLDYQRELYKTRNSVVALSGYTDKQLSAEQQMLKELQEQKTVLEDTYKKQTALLEATVDEAKIQSDLMSGISTSLLSLPDALKALANAVASASKDSVVGTDALTSLYKTLLGREPDAAGLSYWKSVLAGGASLSDIASGIKADYEYKNLHSVPAFESGGDHLGGMRLVGESGPELEVTGPSRIFNASQTRSMLTGGSSDVVAELRSVRQELARQRQELIELKAAANRTAESSESSTGLFRRVIRNDSLITKPA